jgi:spore coat polysaccharide biosynthesis predicted glycosyltransferase SpsG
VTQKDAVREAARRVAPACALHDDVRDMAGVMARCDLAISGGGTTLMELCCVGTPAIVIAQNDAEGRFAASFQERGACRYLGSADRVREHTIRQAFEELAGDLTARRRMAEQGQLLIDGRGSGRTASVLLEAWARHRVVANGGRHAYHS